MVDLVVVPRIIWLHGDSNWAGPEAVFILHDDMRRIYTACGLLRDCILYRVHDYMKVCCRNDGFGETQGEYEVCSKFTFPSEVVAVRLFSAGILSI